VAKYTNSKTIAEMIYEAAEDAAVEFIKDLVVQAAKALLVSIFPPIAPVFAIWALIQQSGVYCDKDEKKSVNGKLIYTIGYKFNVFNRYQIKVTLFVQITVNFQKISELLTKWKNAFVDYVKNKYNELVPKELRDALSKVADAAAKIKADAEELVNTLSEAYLKAKNLIVDSIATLIDKVKNTTVGQWTINKLNLLENLAREYLEKAKAAVNALYSSFKTTVSKLAANVVSALKDAWNAASGWVASTTNKVVSWFRSWWGRRMSYRRVFRAANRRFFNNLRRFRRNRRHSSK